MKKKLIIFDLDGVLINSLSNMKFALNKTSKNLKVKLNFKLYKKLFLLVELFIIFFIYINCYFVSEHATYSFYL